jgi:hypothetical protein
MIGVGSTCPAAQLSKADACVHVHLHGTFADVTVMLRKTMLCRYVFCALMAAQRSATHRESCITHSHEEMLSLLCVHSHLPSRDMYSTRLSYYVALLPCTS